jgi:hypothetical protein
MFSFPSDPTICPKLLMPEGDGANNPGTETTEYDPLSYTKPALSGMPSALAQLASEKTSVIR